MKWRAALAAGVLIAVFICSGCGMNGKITREQAVKSAERCRTDIERIADKYNAELYYEECTEQFVEKYKKHSEFDYLSSVSYNCAAYYRLMLDELHCAEVFFALNDKNESSLTVLYSNMNMQGKDEGEGFDIAFITELVNLTVKRTVRESDWTGMLKNANIQGTEFMPQAICVKSRTVGGTVFAPGAELIYYRLIHDEEYLIFRGGFREAR